MQLFHYLGHPLKSDGVVALIDLLDLDILYHIDLLHENMPGSYSIQSEEPAFELMFDENQYLTTIFHSISPEKTLEEQSAQIGLPLYATIKEAQRAAAALGASLEMRENVAIPELELDVSWAKLTLERHSRHYEYGSDGLQQVTLSVHKAAIT